MPRIMAASADRRVAVRIAAVAAILFIGCGDDAGEPSVVLVTLDTWRSDRVGAYGDPAGRTPALDAWARGGVVVRDAIADVPLTLPSHVTLFTGVPALAHGVRLNEGARLAETATTLAERLRDRGWRTCAIVSTRVLARETGIAQGFAEFDDAVESPYETMNPALFPTHAHWEPRADRRAERAVELATTWLERVKPRERFFLWVHLYDAHFPYDPPLPWIAIDADAYGAEIRSADRALRRLSRALARFDRIVLAVVADHGEGLEDHGESEHGLFLYDETIRVPFLVKGGGLDPGRVFDAQVRTIDVAPTILEMAGDPSPTLGFGESLVGEMMGGRAPVDRLAYSETVLPRASWAGAALKSLRTRTHKFVLAPRPESYDLVRDPAERMNVADGAGEAPRRAALEETVREVLGSGPFLAQPAARSESDREALRALGYVGGAASSARPELADELSVDGFDPKDLVDVALAGRDVENGFYDAAERKLQRFFEGPALRTEDPVSAQLLSLAHQNAAAIAMARGQFDAAAERYRAAIVAEEANLEARSGVVFALNLARRSSEAEGEGARLLAATPDAPKLRLHRALALALVGRRDEARSELEQVASSTRDPAEAQVARDYALRLGTREERAWLDAYLSSEAHARRE